MVAPVHARESGHGHVAGDALAALALGGMVRVRRRVVHLVLMAGHAGVVELLLLEPVAAAGGVAVHAVDLARLGAGAHAPRGERIVLAQVAAVGVEVGVLQGQRGRSGRRTALPAGTPRVSGLALAWQLEQRSFRCSFVMVLVRMIRSSGSGWPLGVALAILLCSTAGAVAGLAVDARLGPGGVVGVGLRVVVGRELAHVAAVAGGIEGVGVVPPVDRLARAPPGKWRMPLAAVSNHSFLLTS